jgi:3-oxoacid CoA-transferase B subunit
MIELTKDQLVARIAKNIADLFNEEEDVFVLNLGVGMPTEVSNYITNENVFIQAENGLVGVGPIATGEEIHPQLINAGRQPVKETLGCAYIDSSISFGMIRGGHVDATVIGAFEVDRHANVANWIIPNGKQLGVGGAMDLVTGAKKVIIAMTHTNKGKPKLIQKCTLPVTGYGEVDVVVTELGMFFFENESIHLMGIAPEINLDYLKSVTDFDFEVSKDLKIMKE